MTRKLQHVLAIIFVFATTSSAFAQMGILRITYDATKGVSSLQDASKVYLHSGVGTSTASAAWETVIGNWGQDDGTGEMTSLGNNKWQIDVDAAYYGLPENTTIYGIGMVFRSADGTATGKDNNGQDIFVRQLDTATPVVLNSDGTPTDVVSVEYVQLTVPFGTWFVQYDATKGVSSLQGASKVYMHSGVGTSTPTAAWETVVGNWGQDDGVGEMSSLGNDQWEIEINPAYYGLALGAIVYNIGMVFRSADGSASGKDDNDQDIFVRGLETETPVVYNADGTPFDGVTITMYATSTNAAVWQAQTSLTNSPNPVSSGTTIQYELPKNTTATLEVWSIAGYKVATLLDSQPVSAGMHTASFDNTATLSDGIYIIKLRTQEALITRQFLLTH